MKADVITLDASKAGTVELQDAIFALEPRKDIMQRMVIYQLAKRRSGNHKTQSRGEVSKHNQRIGKQKGGGTARHGNGTVSQFRGGARAFGPVVRSHAISLPKKVRKMALKHALSSKSAAGNLIILDDAVLPEARTSDLKGKFAKLELSNALIVGGEELDTNFALAARNIINVDVLPAQGINVYDILRRNKLVLTKAAVEKLEARLA